MVNFIGAMPEFTQVLAIPGAHLHAYGKQAHPGRKLGHATLRAQDEQSLRDGIGALLALTKQGTEAGHRAHVVNAIKGMTFENS